MNNLKKLLQEVKACTVCAEHLPLGPRPVVRMNEMAKILIIGQAPGTRVHETGVPWNDASGDRLREWLGLDRDVFYESGHLAIMPMGFCYPGVALSGGDNPPRPECAPLWHERLREHLPNIELTLLVGRHAQKYYLGKTQHKTQHKTMTQTVRHWTDYGPEILPLPHPSWRSAGWLKKNPWFEAEIVPHLHQEVIRLTAS